MIQPQSTQTYYIICYESGKTYPLQVTGAGSELRPAYSNQKEAERVKAFLEAEEGFSLYLFERVGTDKSMEDGGFKPVHRGPSPDGGLE